MTYQEISEYLQTLADPEIASHSQRFFKTVASQWDQLKKEVLGEVNLDAVIIDCSHDNSGQKFKGQSFVFTSQRAGFITGAECHPHRC